MVEFIAILLVVAFLLYFVWPWLWHIAAALVLAFLVYIALPRFWSSKSWEDFKASLQQQRASATSPSGRLYVSPRRSYESREHFEALGQEKYQRPYPRPILLDRRRGLDVFRWRGECWFLRHNGEPYRSLCVVHGGLHWCWPLRPNASAVPCKSSDTGEDGWCWKSEVSYRNDS